MIEFVWSLILMFQIKDLQVGVDFQSFGNDASAFPVYSVVADVKVREATVTVQQITHSNGTLIPEHSK